MKIAISATGESLDATIDERFGRCRYFIFIETDDMRYEAVENTNAELSGSAGIQSAAFVASKGVETVITGSCGPKAMQVFAETSIRVILDQHGKIRDVLEEFKSGTLSPSTQGNVPEKSGVAAGAPTHGLRQPGMGMGGERKMGGGNGMGGCGRGMGGGRGMGMGRRCNTSYTDGQMRTQRPADARSRGQEIAELQQQAEQLKQQMEAIQNRLRDLA